MPIWKDLFKKVVGPIVDDSLKEASDKTKLEKKVYAQPIPLGVSSVGPNGVDKLFARGLNFDILRDFSVYYPILRACINYRKRQITQLEWTVSPRDVIVDKAKKQRYAEDAKKVREFLTYPQGDSTISFRTFIAKALEDLMVLDAVAIYKRKNRRGGVFGYLPVDAATIQLALLEDGTIPRPPQVAYVQKIRGEVTAELTTDELLYRIMNPRTHSPYGLSPVETLIITVTTALKLSTYNLSYLTEGNVPEGFVELPKDIASDPDQLATWQLAWDAMFSGNPQFQRKIKFLPEGMKLHQIKKQEEMEFQRFEQWLLLNTCSVMEVPPQSIGFQFDRGKGATEAEWEIGKERGLYPTANILKEIMDQIIQKDLKQDHLEFVWTNINPTNKKDEVDVFEGLVKYGAVSVDE